MSKSHDDQYKEFLKLLGQEDKAARKFHRNCMFGLILCGLLWALAIVAAVVLLSGCTPTIKIQAGESVRGLESESADTTYLVTERPYIDTFYVGGDTLTLLDSIPCPPGLAKDSVVYLTRTVQSPARVVHVDRVRRDTIRTVLVRASDPTPGQVFKTLPGGAVGSPMWWIGLAALLISNLTAWYFYRRSKKQSKP